MPSIGLLGDSVTEVSYFSAVPNKRWAVLVENVLKRHGDWSVVNYAVSGRQAKHYLEGGTYPPATWTGHDYYIICFGYNETVDGLALFETNLDLLIQAVRDEGAEPILLTQYGVDYPDHYNTDRDIVIEQYNNVIRAVNIGDPTVRLFDLYAAIKTINDAGNWDYRIRNHGAFGGSITDPDYWDDSPFDNDGAGGATNDPWWFTNIHPNVYGNQIIANAVAAFLVGTIVATTTLAAFIAEMVTAMESITPTTKLHNRTPAFKLAKDEQKFREWAPANADSCTRWFTIYDLFDDEALETSDATADIQSIRVEVLVAYQHDFKYGANKHRAFQRVIREDYRKIETTLGIHGQANYTVGCTFKEGGAPFDVEAYDDHGVTILVVPFICRFYQAV